MQNDKDFDDTFLEIQALREKIIHARNQICSAKAALDQKLALCQIVLGRRILPNSDIKVMSQAAAGSETAHSEISGDLLQLREKLCQNVLNRTSESYLCVDGDYKILDVNSAFCNMLNYTRSELLTKSLFDFLQDLSIIADRLDNHIAFAQDLVFKTRQGPKPGRARFTPVCDRQGRLLYFFAFVAHIPGLKPSVKIRYAR